MPIASRLVTLTIELRYDTTVEEQAVLDGDDEDAQARLDQAAIREAAAHVDLSRVDSSRFRVGIMNGSAGSSWVNWLPS